MVCTIAAVIIFLFVPHPVWQGGISQNLTLALAYIAGSVFSGLVGKIGISVATNANVKCAEAAVEGNKRSFMVGLRRSGNGSCSWVLACLA